MTYKVTEFCYLIKPLTYLKFTLVGVSMSGVEPLSEAYESPVLTVELHRHVETTIKQKG